MKKKIYEILFNIFAIIAVIFAIIDISKGLTQVQYYVNLIIYIIFVIDYFARLILSEFKTVFIKQNIFDLLAIIPFNSLFRAFRLFRLFRLAKLLKISKLFKLSKFVAYWARVINKCKNFLNTNGFKYMLLLSLASIFIGAITITFFEKMKFSDGLWWAFVTTTTVGYGDLSPNTTAGRIIAVFLMLIGIGLVSSLTSTITGYFFTSKKISYKDSIIDDIRLKLDNLQSLSDEDIDDICKVLKSLKK